MGKLPTGTGKGLYGYRWDRDSKKRTPVEYEVKIVRRIFAMLAGGSGYFNIARTLNEQGVPTKTGAKWCPRTIYSMAGNPAYIGMTYYYRTHGSRKTKLVKNPESEWALLPETTPAIISKEVFDRVQEIRQQNRELHQAKTTHDYLLRGHVRCGYCGAPLVGSCLSHSFRYYHCRATYPTAARLKTCNARYIRADNLENIVWENIRKALEQPEVVLAGVKEQLDTENNSAVQGLSVDNEIGKLTKQAKKYAAEEKRLIQLIRYGELIRDLELDEINRLKAEREANDRKLNELSAAKEKIASLEKAEVKLEECCQKLRSHLDNATYQEKREILDMLAIKVTATPDSIKIEGVIPIETTPSENALASVEATHHWTNMGMSVTQ